MITNRKSSSRGVGFVAVNVLLALPLEETFIAQHLYIFRTIFQIM